LGRAGIGPIQAQTGRCGTKNSGGFRPTKEGVKSIEKGLRAW
jgi:hypothetical protein